MAARSGLIGRLLGWLFPDPCAGTLEIQRQMQSTGDDEDGER
jgi:hypothetical protein